MRSEHLWQLTAAVFLLASTPAFATDYYVRNGGSDALNGQSPGTAWATLGHAANVVSPGDTVHVQDGSYQGFYLSRSGSLGHPITFVADGSAAQITADNGTTPDGINVEGAAYVIIDGFVVNNRTRAGIRTALSQFVTVRNCHTGYNGTWGIFSGFAEDFTIEFNETHHSQTQHGIYVSNSGDRPIIRGNIVHDNHAAGIHMNGDLSQGGDGLISNAVVERNVLYGNGVGGGSAINMDGITNSIVRDNLIYDNHASGISLYQIDGATGSTHNVVVNNTIVNAADGRWCVNINSGSFGNAILNNILYNDHPFRGAIAIDASSRPGFVSDYNSVLDRFSTDTGDTVMPLASWQALGYDAHSFLATPADLFITPGADFHLRPGSPALDAGSADNAPAFDIDDNPRPVGAGFDLGAYESQLPNCGNGSVDPGEQCGEPSLSCTDACTACANCICAALPQVCGDGNVCGDEQCEVDADCSSGGVCHGCQCENAAACSSGIVMKPAGLRVRAAPFGLMLSGRAIIPKPWQAVNPLLNGVRLRLDAISGPGGVDITIPGGAFTNGVGWKLDRSGRLWTYSDRSGGHGGVTYVAVRDRSRTTDGLVGWLVRAHGGSITLPDVKQVRAALVLGDSLECAQIVWNPPGAPRPRCAGNAAHLTCR